MYIASRTASKEVRGLMEALPGQELAPYTLRSWAAFSASLAQCSLDSSVIERAIQSATGGSSWRSISAGLMRVEELRPLR